MPRRNGRGRCYSFPQKSLRPTRLKILAFLGVHFCTDGFQTPVSQPCACPVSRARSARPNRGLPSRCVRATPVRAVLPGHRRPIRAGLRDSRGCDTPAVHTPDRRHSRRSRRPGHCSRCRSQADIRSLGSSRRRHGRQRTGSAR